MFIDYLRYVAFNGYLRSFFEERLSDYVEAEVTTGQHLRFAPPYVHRHLPYLRYPDVEGLLHYYNYYDLGFRIEHWFPGFITKELSNRPVTFTYDDYDRPDLEVIIDVDPKRWSDRYIERRNYEGTTIVYRPVSAAKAHWRSGDRIFPESNVHAGHGTICGLFCASNGDCFALTCGHVVNNASQVFIEGTRRKFWKLQLPSTGRRLGDVRHFTLCDKSPNLTMQEQQLDAALIKIEGVDCRKHEDRPLSTSVRSISTLLQEEIVSFHGSVRRRDTVARVLSLTVKKSIDLLNDGILRDVGDVIMLGHPARQYFVQSVSRPGDSGAAVRLAPDSKNAKWGEWHGMILGSDEAGAYATHAEHLWAWASKKIGDPEMDFAFELEGPLNS